MECTQNRSENMSEKVTTEKDKMKKAESLPEWWKRVRLGEVIEEVNERVGKKNLEPVAVGINGIKKRSDIYYKELAEDYSNNKILRTGYIAFGLGSNEMAIGVNFFENDFCVSPAYKVFKIKDQDILFSHYFFDFFKRIVGSKFLILSARQGKAVDFILLLNEYVLLPPLPEQRKIAEILETVDNAIEKTDAIIEKYRRIKKGLMADLLTGKIRLIPYGHSEAEGEESPLLTSPEAKKFVIGDKTFIAVPNQKWKNSPIGKIPEDWEVKKLGEIAQIIMGQSPNSAFINKEGKGMPFLQGNAEFTEKFPVPIYWIEKPLKVAKPKSILMSVRAPVGDLNIADRFYCIGRGLSCISTFESYAKSEFMWHILHFSVKDLINLGQGSTFEAIGSNEIKSHLFPLPPLPEQQLIADVLSQVDEVIEKEIQYKEKLERIKKGLMEDLLTGKVRVNNLIKEG
jgi:type I restriction enzyme S subunit